MTVDEGDRVVEVAAPGSGRDERPSLAVVRYTRSTADTSDQ